jgi:hypothetical protein
MHLLAYYLVGASLIVWDFVATGMPLGAALFLASFMGFVAGVAVGAIWEYLFLPIGRAVKRWFQRQVDAAVARSRPTPNEGAERPTR